MSKGAPRQREKREQKGDVKKMADFTTSTTTKSAIRNLTEPLADVTAFDNLVQGVIASNPFRVRYLQRKGSEPRTG